MRAIQAKHLRVTPSQQMDLNACRNWRRGSYDLKSTHARHNNCCGCPHSWSKLRPVQSVLEQCVLCMCPVHVLCFPSTNQNVIYPLQKEDYHILCSLNKLVSENLSMTHFDWLCFRCGLTRGPHVPQEKHPMSPGDTLIFVGTISFQDE